MESPAKCTYQEHPQMTWDPADIQSSAVGFASGLGISDCLAACDALDSCGTVLPVTEVACFLATPAAVLKPAGNSEMSAFTRKDQSCSATGAIYASLYY